MGRRVRCWAHIRRPTLDQLVNIMGSRGKKLDDTGRVTSCFWCLSELDTWDFGMLRSVNQVISLITFQEVIGYKLLG